MFSRMCNEILSLRKEVLELKKNKADIKQTIIPGHPFQNEEEFFDLEKDIQENEENFFIFVNKPPFIFLWF